MPQERGYFSDPVAAYDRVARCFDGLAAARGRYLDGIDDLIISRIAPGSVSLLDVGAGDGRRALRIAEGAGLRNVVLLEPSAEMARRVSGTVESWRIRAEELDPLEAPAQGRNFDVITCLWNVLGHIRPERARAHVLGCLRGLLSPQGILFVDVTHRYNMSSYGVMQTASRFLRDRLRPSECNGDVTAKWELDDSTCSTYGHVFTDREMRRLIAAAELNIKQRIVMDYDTGRVRRFRVQGNLFYVLRSGSSSSVVSNAVQTSSISAAVS